MHDLDKKANEKATAAAAAVGDAVVAAAAAATAAAENVANKKGAIPHQQIVPRKPDPKGCELKTLADGISGRMLRCEIIEGKEACGYAPTEFEDVYQKHAALTLRLTKPYQNSGRVVVGDAHFSSVTNAVAHRKVGLHVLMNVKGNTGGFCKKELMEALEGKPVATCREG